MSDPRSTLCKHCGEPIFDNGTVYVHRRSTFDEVTKTKYVIESQWCNDATRIHMAESANSMLAVPSGGERQCRLCGSDDPRTRLCELLPHGPGTERPSWIHSHGVGEPLNTVLGVCKPCRDPWHDQPTIGPNTIRTPEGLATLGIGSQTHRQESVVTHGITGWGPWARVEEVAAPVPPTQQDEPKPPLHPIEIRISIGAEDWEYVHRRLGEWWREIDENGHLNVHCTGGAGGSASVTIAERPVSKEQFREELESWRQNLKK